MKINERLVNKRSRVALCVDVALARRKNLPHAVGEISLRTKFIEVEKKKMF